MNKGDLNSVQIIRHIFLVSGIYDLRDLVHTIVNENDRLSLTEANAIQLSPMFIDYSKWSQLNLKIVLFSAENDSPTFKMQAQQMITIWKQKYNLECEYYFVPICDHFDIIEKIVDPKHILTEVILKTV